MRSSASSRTVDCPYSLVGPQEPTSSPYRDKAAAFGTYVHAWAETGETEIPGVSKTDIACLEKKILLSGIRREDYWPQGKGEREITFAVNLLEPSVVWYEGPRDGADAWKARAGNEHGWLTGTVDWKAHGGVISDLKTGSWPVHAASNKQLYSYALPWWIEAGCPVIGYLQEIAIEQFPRYPLNGLPQINTALVTGLQLASHLEDLRYALSHPEEANPSLETCRFCDVKPNCSAFLASGISYERR